LAWERLGEGQRIAGVSNKQFSTSCISKKMFSEKLREWFGGGKGKTVSLPQVDKGQPFLVHQ
jgi:hypothetical protein